MIALGAMNEGVMRQHKIVQHDYVRDTVMFGVVQSDWPKVKQILLNRMTHSI